MKKAILFSVLLALLTTAGALPAEKGGVQPASFTGRESSAGGRTAGRAQRVPLGLLVTNWGCGPCLPANNVLDEYMATQGNDVALLRVHGWWPSTNDPMYLANPVQAHFLIENTPTGADYAPHLWLDNYVSAGASTGAYVNRFEAQKLVPAPLTLALSYAAQTSEVTVTIDVIDTLPSGDYVLYVAVTEDDIYAPSPNGELYHNQTFRYLYPDVAGLAVTSDLGIQQLVVPLALDPSWEFYNLRATAWVQDSAAAGPIMNAATMFLDSTRGRMLVAGPGPGEDNPPLVRVYPHLEGSEPLYEFSAYGAPHFGVNVSCGDLTGDGVAEILTGAGPGAVYGPQVRGFQVDGTPLSQLSFLAYGTNKYGVNVAAGDIDGDGMDEIITGAGPGAVFGPHVRGWNYDAASGVAPIPGVSYFAYGTPKWGVNVAAGDIDGDGYDEIVTGAGPGTVYGPHVRGWNVDGGTAAAMPGVSFFAYGTNQFGVNVTCGDIDGDGIDEIATGPGPGQVFGAHIRGWNYDGVSLTPMAGISFFAWPPGEARYGAKVFAGADLDGDGRAELLVGAGPDPSVGTPLKVYRYNGSQVAEWFSMEAFDGLTRGTTVAAGSF